jgi:hypothetical protein
MHQYLQNYHPLKWPLHKPQPRHKHLHQQIVETKAVAAAQEDVKDHLLQKNKYTMHSTKHSNVLEEVQEVQEVLEDQEAPGNLQEKLVHHKTSFLQHPT